MHRVALAALLALAPLALPLAANEAKVAKTPGIILVLGDSLSAAYGIDYARGWVALLQQRLDRERASYRVVNASISGDTTAGGLNRLPPALASHRPRIVVVELGGNDGLRGLELDATRRNLADIVRLSLESGAEVLLLGMRLPPNYGPRYTKAFYMMYGDIADELNVSRVPFFMEGVGGKPDLMQPDGIHPGAEAQRLLLDNVWPHLEPLL